MYSTGPVPHGLPVWKTLEYSILAYGTFTLFKKHVACIATRFFETSLWYKKITPVKRMACLPSPYSSESACRHGLRPPGARCTRPVRSGRTTAKGSLASPCAGVCRGAFLLQESLGRIDNYKGTGQIVSFIPPCYEGPGGIIPPGGGRGNAPNFQTKKTTCRYDLALPLGFTLKRPAVTPCQTPSKE